MSSRSVNYEESIQLTPMVLTILLYLLAYEVSQSHMLSKYIFLYLYYVPTPICHRNLASSNHFRS